MRARLAERAENPEADLRARIAAARPLGRLGDPRYETVGPEDGEALAPPLCVIPERTVFMGSPEEDASARPDEKPRHEVSVAGFSIARFPVTNAEWRRFSEAGGYEDDRWWDSEVVRAWRRGEGVTEGQKHNWRSWRQRFIDDPASLDAMAERGLMPPDDIEQWRRFTSMDAPSFERTLEGMFPDGREIHPRHWAEPA